MISISLFQAASSRSVAECERHYLEHHTVWARHMLRENKIAHSYHTALALARLGERGFLETPTRWRYVILERNPQAVGFPPEIDEEIASDHRNFLQDWEGFAAQRFVPVDRRCGQLTFEAYLAEFDTDPDADRESAFSGLTQRLAAAGSQAYGLRLIQLDQVLTESGSEAIDLPGQRPIRQAEPARHKLAFALILFDQHEWAQDWFLRPDVRAAFAAERALGITHSAVHHVLLRCGFDDN